MKDFAYQVGDYFRVLDEALERLSHKHEGKISRLPGWTLTPRRIFLGFSPDGAGLFLSVIPDRNLDTDEIQTMTLTSSEDITKFTSGWHITLNVDQLSREPFVCIGDVSVVQKDNPLAPPAMDYRGLFGWGSLEDAAKAYTGTDAAKMEAINLWNKALNDWTSSGSFILETKNIFAKFEAIAKRKAFVERKIHRFLNEHGRILLPGCSRYFFEHEIYLGGETRKIDFVLKRETGIAPILIELEPPTMNVFRKDGDLTADANHAKGQITDWVRFIDCNPQINASGEFSFLAGPKNRLVIMGRGLEQIEHMLHEKFSDTMFWTYDLLLSQARGRLNEQIAEQCRIIGAQPIKPF